MVQEIRNRRHVYLTDETVYQLAEISEFLKSSQMTFKQERNQSQIINLIISTFYDLFIKDNESKKFHELLGQYQKGQLNQLNKIEITLKSFQKQMDLLKYLELTNFHSISKGPQFDIQDLESIHSKIDPQQHELLARIDDIIKTDVARGQTQKHSH
ncbi:hypothetical protein DIX60_10620 [Streptococcus iniae]|uniref:hypothetical protein n=1 Tax=Streptococcus iniae TaxID=1346 RepID=UPI0002DC7DA4|nr:hypothetical protein [Streptococcus iniae]ESR08819.1 hypothetical protein IUSA1_10205 [Streptococcus iniae IUSA1]RLV26738.1 hypothetical protein DIX60_10620 [Streptococcus iniae]